MVAIRSLLLSGVAAKGLKILVSLVRIAVAPRRREVLSLSFLFLVTYVRCRADDIRRLVGHVYDGLCSIITSGV